ncbi:hypothetical protein KR093_008658 [Drosophila rubida]|uniref:Serum response factor-binding protein 1 n=1 Tax=Drosophila rubida TaxID=30044 RepID=A0AAD4JU36_9MUSC|nr:hypothetical protein KR093_008658 [Drosophila rubida]
MYIIHKILTSFNPQVITNKKVIQQARAQAIAKVVQKLRKLKDALEKQPDSEVHKERLRKNVEYMAQLKSLKIVDIMRSLMLKDAKQLNAVLTNGRATPEEVAIAMLGLNKLMQGLLDKFQKSLSLSTDANAKWREEILQTSKRRLKLERTEEKRRKRKELKELKAQSRKRQEWLEQNKPVAIVDTEVDSNTKLITTVAGNVEVEKVTEVNQTPTEKKKEKSKAKSKEIKQKVPKPIENKHKTREKSNKVDDKTDRLQDTLPKVHKTKQSQQEKQPKVEAPNKKRKKEEKERPTHVVDPFFITESGQPYLSTAVVLSDDNETDSEDEEQVPRNEYKKHNPLKKWEDKSAARDNNRHPSWLAKEKLKPIITGFKGKKTTFADDGSTKQTIPAVLPPAAPAAESIEAGMHPSWIAKQKLKPKIAAFAGTKIKFDD